MPKLIACPSCHSHVRADEGACPHCGGHVRNDAGVVARTTTAVLMGLALAGCPADDDDTSDTASTIGDEDTEYGVPATEGTTDASSTSDTGDMTSTGIGEPEYGVADTGGFETTGGSSSSGTDGSSSSGGGEPDYGVPETTGE